MARQVAALNSPVLLRGETGTGKDMIANAIHQLSLFKEGPFVKVNCGAIPESLIDAEPSDTKRGVHRGVLPEAGLFRESRQGNHLS